MRYKKNLFKNICNNENAYKSSIYKVIKTYITALSSLKLYQIVYNHIKKNFIFEHLLR